MLKITTGNENYEILDSGTVITFREESLSFQLVDNLKVRLTFTNNEANNEKKMDAKIVEDKILDLTFINFNESLGVGNGAPLPIAKINNKQVYLNFVIYALNNTQKTVHYTFYSREEVANG
jgi:hypothetical protein